MKEKTPTVHIGAKYGDIAESILLPGDPLRAKVLAEKYLEECFQFNSVRNMYGYTGFYKGKRISVMGTGMGCPSIGIYSYELINFYGCKNLIRIGTAGAMNEKVKIRDLVIAMGASTNSNYVKLMGLPGDYSCIGSFELVRKAAEKCEEYKYRYHVGNVLTSDAFYSQNLSYGGKSWQDMGILAVEMETAALYANAASGGANALGMFTVSDSLVTGEELSSEERELSFTNMMDVALGIV